MDIQKTKLLFFSFIVVLFSFNAALSQSQLEMNRQACDEYKKADAKLNRTYQQILSEYKKDALFIQKMKRAQQAWIIFRDAQIEALYPLEQNANPNQKYGSVYPMCNCIALTQITEKRTEELKQWIDGTEEGDVCSGSIKTKDEDEQ